ncbi:MULTISPECIES: response regulator transcription factor [Herpetosiphon]|uniref:Fis family transcriptional regulator n=1 Tax=Herpetosiphon geysericola TaxID=70996 RepID=A0A0P6YXS1_9CHLR|nr:MULTISPECIES: response regulator transcription factor [Herpetosiphon]KPL88908.1 Fis family transcriptional regulator [Herpetosiphon geysericola]MBM7842415.1 two-component system KDP operon response regulator KdpE [Herpetosiphon giganteus]
MEQPLILVVDDEPDVAQLLSLQLTMEKYRVQIAYDGPTAIEYVRSLTPDLIILDVMLPAMDGYETCRRIREFSNVPILMLTANIQDQQIVSGLDSGADDYMTKPYSPSQLLARVRALLRRIPPQRPIITAGEGLMVLDRQRRELKVKDKVIDLTPTEYQLLILLADSVGQVVPHEKLLGSIWGSGKESDHDSLKVYIWHLRRKLEDNPRQPKILLTEWGVGYRLAE